MHFSQSVIKVLFLCQKTMQSGCEVDGKQFICETDVFFVPQKMSSWNVSSGCIEGWEQWLSYELVICWYG